MNNIIRSIYLGNIKDAFFAGEQTPMDTLYVHEDVIPYYAPTYHVAILNVEPQVELVVGDYFAAPKAEENIDKAQRKRLVNPGALAAAHLILDDYYENYKPLLIHCLGGVERSPLTLATWLIRIGEQPDLDAAYKFLMAKRDVVEDRRHWLAQPT